MEKIENIAICGGGNLGLVCSGVILSEGYNVSVLSGHPEKWNKELTVYDPEGQIYSGLLKSISSEPADIIQDADLILITQPGFLIEKTLQQIKPYLQKDAVVGSIVSSTGFFFAAHKVLSNNQPLFGFQRVPFISRIREYGKTGDLLGYKNSLSVAIENIPDAQNFCEILIAMFKAPVRLLNNFYEASLTNSNPILHTGRLYSMWGKSDDENVFDRQSFFYYEWTDEASEYLIRMDNEFQNLLRKLGIRKDAIPPILEYYESVDAESLTRKIKSIPAFREIKSPMKEISTGVWVPDYSSRYFTEDFPYGLRFIRDLAREHDVASPTIDEVYTWGESHIGQKQYM